MHKSLPSFVLALGLAGASAAWSQDPGSSLSQPPVASPGELLDRFKSLLDAPRPAGAPADPSLPPDQQVAAPQGGTPAAGPAPSPAEVVQRVKDFLGVPPVAKDADPPVPNMAPLTGSARLTPALLQQMEALRTDDVVELQKRWGAWGMLAGRSWMYSWGTDRYVVFDPQWKVPGAVLAVAIVSCEQGACRYRKGVGVTNPVATRFSLANLRGLPKFDMLWDDGREDEGTVLDLLTVQVGNVAAGTLYKFDPAQGPAVIGGQQAHAVTRDDLAVLARLNVMLAAGSAQSQLDALDAESARKQAQAAAERSAAEAQARAEAERQQVAAAKEAVEARKLAAQAEKERKAAAKRQAVEDAIAMRKQAEEDRKLQIAMKRMAAEQEAVAKAQAQAEARKKQELAKLARSWGPLVLALEEGPTWAVGGNGTTWTELRWIIPGRQMRLVTGYCRRGNCSTQEYDVKPGRNEGSLQFAALGTDIRLAATVRNGQALTIDEGAQGSARADNLRVVSYAFRDDAHVLVVERFAQGHAAQTRSSQEAIADGPDSVAGARREEARRLEAQRRAFEAEQRRIAYEQERAQQEERLARMRRQQAEEQEEEAQSEPQVNPFQVFADTLKGEMVKGNAQRAQQQQWLNNLQAQARAQQEARRAQQQREAQVAAQQRQEAYERQMQALRTRQESLEREQRSAAQAGQEAQERQRAQAQARQQADERERLAARARQEAADRARQEAAQSARPVQSVAVASNSFAAEKRSEPAANTKKRDLLAYPEAIVVCTRPNDQGQFKCDTPLHTGLGGSAKSSFSEDRTPEAKVASMSSVCKNARRLRSSTHLVWGCGFAATGVSPYLDRAGPGVDVQGRQTYYCPEKYPFTCTTTQP